MLPNTIVVRMNAECGSLPIFGHAPRAWHQGVSQNRELRMENEVPSVNRVDEIREKLQGLQGERLKVRANMGRSRIVERTGTLVMAHPSLFVLEVDEHRGRKARQSYQYVDVLTGTVELFDIETGERLFDFVAAEPLE